jgi:hypothetical protein
MGVDIAKAALAAGHAAVATGRNTDTVIQALGEHDDLLRRRARRHQPAELKQYVPNPTLARSRRCGEGRACAL